MAQPKPIKEDTLRMMLAEEGGNVTRIADKLKVSRLHVYNEFKRHGITQEERDEARTLIFEYAESSALDLVKEKHPSMCMFILKTLGKKYGYSEQDIASTQMIGQMVQLWAQTLTPQD